MPKAKPVIGISMSTGEEIRYPSLQNTAFGGFDPDKVWRVVHGKANHHGGFIWHYEGEEPRKPMTVREWGRLIARPVKATGPDGEWMILRGTRDMVEAGFSPKCVYNVLAGRNTRHQGWLFEYVQGNS